MTTAKEKEPYRSGAEMYQGFALDMLGKKDLGSAMYYFYVAENLFRDAGNIASAEEIKTNDLPLVRKLMEADFKKIALEKGLVLTDDNFQFLFEEHSPTYNSYKRLSRSYNDLTNALEKGSDYFIEKLENIVRIAKGNIKEDNSLNYFGDNFERIMEWEEWKGDIEIDLDACYSALITLSNDDFLEEYQEEESMIREQLDKIKQFKEDSQ
ncbi:hypothetical protein KY332_01300 [Candidatus Woesearchaeota archaeon]|nr:hypothetical protein [Candidatus Woesearchaeota archaeon]